MNERYEAENRKYHAPSARVVPLSSGNFAVIDHHYQVFALCTLEELLFTVQSCIRSAPQRIPPHARPAVPRKSTGPDLGDIEL